MTSLNVNNSYSDWLKEVKARVKVALAANNDLIAFYWDLGKMILETQTAYGTGFLEQISKYLSKEFPDMKGFSYRNLAMCRQFYQFYSSANLQQPVADLQIIDNDSLIKSESDNPTIGILLCRDKNNFETEFALRDINKPMGVSEFQLTEILPDELKSSLPTIEEIEKELNTED